MFGIVFLFTPVTCRQTKNNDDDSILIEVLIQQASGQLQTQLK